MVTTFEISPSPALATFVRCYTHRTFNTNGQDVVKPWYANPEPYLIFFFGDIPVKMVTQTGKTIYGKKFGAVGVVTKYMGEMTMNGNYSFLSVQFRPNGFSKIFRMRSHEIINDIVSGEDFFDASLSILYNQLVEAISLHARIVLLDKYLFSLLNKQHFVDRKDAITCLSNSIAKNPSSLNVNQLAYAANMSVRNFERKFQEHVGVSPKLFCRISRFNKALDIKLRNPSKDWTSIAQQMNYFDQMHFIKECKEFTGSNPSVFIKETQLLEKDFSNRLNE